MNESEDGLTRRDLIAATGAASVFAGLPHKAWAAETATAVGPTILEYLTSLDDAVRQLANTWKPDDPLYRADLYRQIMMNLSYSYFVYFHADPEHPDWAPLWNPVYTQQPNPDTIYLYAPLRGDLSYRVSGNRGTCHSLVFSTQHGFSGMVDSFREMSNIHTFDDKGLKIGPDGEFEIIFSAKRPAGVEFQYYWPAAFEFSPGEALVIETDLPKIRPYWNVQLNDPYFNCIEFVYRLSSLNGATAKVGSDGKFRAVIALEDPGVPNWLDPAGYTEGTIWGRWYGCDSTPLPMLKRVKLTALRDVLPQDTPTVTPAQRAEELRTRVRAAQRRRRW